MMLLLTVSSKMEGSNLNISVLLLQLLLPSFGQEGELNGRVNFLLEFKYHVFCLFLQSLLLASKGFF
jgi:hypothetical protein